MGGLFHDIGKKEIPREILDKPRIQLNQQEKAVLETHPTRGMEILSKIPSIPEDVAVIAHQHHEDVCGYGYPLGIKKNKIYPLARIVSVANVFCEYVIKGPNSEGMPAKEAINRILKFQKDGLDPEYLAALLKLFNVQHQLD